jgi:hypothetical protein
VRPIYRTGTPLPSEHPILYIFSTNILTEFFKHAAHSPFFSPQNAVYFIMLPFWFLYYSHFKYRVCYNLNAKFRCQKVKHFNSIGYLTYRYFRVFPSIPLALLVSHSVDRTLSLSLYHFLSLSPTNCYAKSLHMSTHKQTVLSVKCINFST